MRRSGRNTAFGIEWGRTRALGAIVCLALAGCDRPNSIAGLRTFLADDGARLFEVQWKPAYGDAIRAVTVSRNEGDYKMVWNVHLPTIVPMKRPFRYGEEFWLPLKPEGVPLHPPEPLVTGVDYTIRVVGAQGFDVLRFTH